MPKTDVNYFGSNPILPDNGGELRSEAFSSHERDVQLGFDMDFSMAASSAEAIPASYTLTNVPRGAWVEIDLGAIAYNVKLARAAMGPGKQLMAVVKADGYGHGAYHVAKTALDAGATRLAVATPEEGVTLRRQGITAPILILAQPPMRTIPLLVKYDIATAVYTSDFALALGEAAVLCDKKAAFHLAVDTGMNRIGVHYREVVDFIHEIDFHRGLELEGVFTHFATADAASDWDFRIQQQRFEEALTLLRDARIDPGIVHCANSVSIFRYPEVHYDMGRLGICMYGLYPSPETRDIADLRPAMSVKAQISYIKEPQLGEGVGYGLNYRVAKPVQIATVPLGYADGLRRSLQGRMKVLINGRRCRQVGNICMDQVMVEVPLGHSIRGVAGGAEIGDEVVIIGSQGDEVITADDMAEMLETINYEVTCLFGIRLPKIYV